MPELTQTIKFPAELASKILWSPNIDEGSGRNSQTSYVLIAHDSKDRVASPTVGDLALEKKEVSVLETKISNLSAEPGPPAIDGQTTTVVEANETAAEAVPADDSSNDEGTPSQDEHVIPILPDSIREEMKAYTSYKFSVDIQMESVKGHNDFYTEKKQSWHMDKKKIVEPVVHLYCPHAECHEVIDEAVRDIAKHEGAEVLTLDALELASGENSILGDQIQEALSALYKDSTRPDREEKIEAISESDAVTDSSDDTSDEESARKRRRERRRRRKAIEQRKKKAKNELKEKERKKKEEAKKNDMEIQAIFDALVSLSPQDSVAPAKKRIVYIRDFGSIAGVSSPLVVRLLRAIHARRVAKFSDGVESEDLIQPTLLILGYSSSGSDGNIVESTFVHGGTRLRMVLPHIGAGSLGHGSFTSITLSPISSQFFSRTLVVKKEYPKDDSDYSDNDIEYRPDYGRRLLDYPYNPALRTTVAPPYERTWMPYDATDDNPILSLGGFDLSSASLAMSVFFKGEEKKALTSLEESLCDRRTTDIANAWFKLSLTQRKRRLTCDDVITFLGNDEDLQKELARDNDKDREEKRMKKERARFTIQVIGENKSKKTSKKAKGPRGPYKGQALLARLAEFVDSSISVTLDKGVAIVLGLSSSGQTSGSADVPEVPLSDFSKAFQTLIHGHQSRAEWWKKEPNSDDKTDDSNDSGKDEDPVVKSVKEATDLTSHEKGLLSSIVDPNELTTSFGDVCISEKTVETLRTIISLRLKFPDAFTSGVLGRESLGGVLLYGPPGTGKTMVCRAVARECGARMLVIKPSDVMEKWLGESEKQVKAIFTLAYRLAPCLIFVDELDSLFGKRKDDDKKWERDILAEFLQFMDGLKSAKQNKDAGVVLIGATNRPQDIDEAVIRRLPSRMMVDAPDEKQRQRILELHLRGETLHEDVNLHDIAVKTINYSGSDLKNVCVSAAMTSVKDAIGTFTWEPIKSKDVPKAGDDSTAGDGDGDEEANKAKEIINKRTVTMNHLLAALADVPGSLFSSSTGQSELHRWHMQYGTGASSQLSYGTRPGGYTSGAESWF